MNKRENKRTNSFKNIMADCHCDPTVYCRCGSDPRGSSQQYQYWTPTMREQAWSGVRPSSL